tara:strand:+ start:1096 stop:2649 length:1554 start_codon:yes stop_codon:yes gene_type:complete
MSQKNKFKLGPKKIILFLTAIALIVIGAILIFSFLHKREQREKLVNLENDYKVYCGSCHMVPNPANIPKSLWKNKVLPEMAKRMGLKDYTDGSPRYSEIEKYHIEFNKAYPEVPLLDSLTWQQLHDYVIRMAPDSVPNLPVRKGRNSVLTQFEPSFKIVNKVKPSGGIVNIKFDDNTKELLVGDVFGQLYDLKSEPDLKLVLNSPIISSVTIDSIFFATEIGIMNPSEVPKGVIYSVDSDTITPLFKALHRPVYTEIVDLNDDGKNEIIICEFGHLTGELSLLVKEESVFKKRTLLALPGSIKVDVVDMDNDGKKDIVALFAQGREGIYIFYQKDNLEFSVDPVVLMPPEYGSSWFSLLDYNNDGHLDILLANGDNADYSRFLKPYHGVRLFINNGKNEFTEKWFYPINGATRVLVDDFDMDGDFDFAVLSFFPDFEDGLEEGFVYLENKDTTNYVFTAHTTEDAKNGNWLVMEKGDFDGDGDVDIMLGNFNMLAPNKFRSSKKNDLLFLENKLIKK